MERELTSLNQMLELLYGSKSNYDKVANRLQDWLKIDSLNLSVKESIERFSNYKAEPDDLKQIQSALRETKEEVQKNKDLWSAELLEIKRQYKEVSDQVDLLKNGQKAYPPYLTKAREIIVEKLNQYYKNRYRQIFWQT